MDNLGIEYGGSCTEYIKGGEILAGEPEGTFMEDDFDFPGLVDFFSSGNRQLISAWQKDEYEFELGSVEYGGELYFIFLISDRYFSSLGWCLEEKGESYVMFFLKMFEIFCGTSGYLLTDATFIDFLRLFSSGKDVQPYSRKLIPRLAFNDFGNEISYAEETTAKGVKISLNGFYGALKGNSLEAEFFGAI